MSKTSRRWRRVWLVRILPPVSAGYTNGWEKKSTLRRGDGTREGILTKASGEHAQDGGQAYHYLAVFCTDQLCSLRSRPASCFRRLGTNRIPTAMPEDFSS